MTQQFELDEEVQVMECRTAQLDYNKKYHEKWAAQLFSEWGWNADYDIHDIKERMEQINVNKTVRGVYESLKTLLQREPDRRSEREIKEKWAETCRQMAKEVNEPGWVLDLLDAFHAGMRPWESNKVLASYVGKNIRSKTVQEMRRIMGERRKNPWGNQPYTLYEYATYYDPACAGDRNEYIRDLWMISFKTELAIEC